MASPTELRLCRATADYGPAVFRKGGVTWAWEYQINLSKHEIAKILQPGDSFILVDQGTFTNEMSAGGRAIPFLEREGQYWGPPPDDATAIQELERLRRSRSRVHRLCVAGILVARLL